MRHGNNMVAFKGEQNCLVVQETDALLAISAAAHLCKPTLVHNALSKQDLTMNCFAIKSECGPNVLLQSQ